MLRQAGRHATAVNTALPHFAYQRVWHLPQTSVFSSGHSQNLPKLSGIVPVTMIARADIKQGVKLISCQVCNPLEII